MTSRRRRPEQASPAQYNDKNQRNDDLQYDSVNTSWIQPVVISAFFASFAITTLVCSNTCILMFGLMNVKIY